MPGPALPVLLPESAALAPVLRAIGLARHYPLPRPHPLAARPWLRAVDGVDLHVDAGEILAIVGESGSGKSTLARLLAGLEAPDAGSLIRRGRVQMVFQDPSGALNPRWTAARTIAEPIRHLPATERAARVAALLAEVGLGAAQGRQYPHALSGGQRQRVAIARALAPRPELILADEPVSALDPSIQAQVLNLLLDLRDTNGVAMIFISHDLATVRHLADRVAVMAQGRIVETGPTIPLLANPQHPDTRRLLAAAGM